MIVSLGEQVVGKNGTLGRIAGFRFDPNTQSADQMVIKHGLPFHSGHLAVLGFVTGVETGVVRIDLSKQEFEELEQYKRSAYNASDRGPGMMPPFDSQGDNHYKHAGPVPFASTADRAILPEHSDERINETHAQPPTYPTGADVTPGDKQPIVVSRGTEVLDRDGIKVGQVRSFAVETTTGQPTRITLESGIFGRDGCDLPLDMVQSYGTRAIVLSAATDQIQTCT